MRQHAAFDLPPAYGRPVGVKGSLRRASPALDPAQTPKPWLRHPLEIQERQKLLPVTIAYFDDTLGSPTRIGSLFRNRWCGQLAAIDDFNSEHRHRKIDILRTLKARRPLDKALWLDKMYGVHVLDHPARQPGSQRPPLAMGAHGSQDRMNWPL